MEARHEMFRQMPGRDAERLFQALLDAAPDAMVGVDGGGTIVMANAQTVAVFGYDREDLIGRPLELLLPERSRGVHARHFRDYFRDPRVRPMGIGLELAGRRADGSEFPAEISLGWIETVDGPVALGAIRDITDRKRAENEAHAAREKADRAASELEAVREAEGALRRQALIFDNMSDAVMITDLEGLVIDVNPAAERLTGIPKAALVGRRAEFLGAPGHEDELRETIAAELAETGRFTGVLPFRRSNGSEGFAELVVVPLLDGHGEPLGSIGVSRDISERIQTEERLRETIDELLRTVEQRRQLLSRLVAAQEEERLRIAADIHDDPIQQLYAAGLRLAMLEERLEDPQQREVAERVGSMIEGTIGGLRRMLFELQPTSLETAGLGAALDEYVEYANQEGETQVVLEDRLTVELSTEIRSVAYRVVLEALSNVRRHARATTATVTIEDHEDGMRCSVVDDGHGFLMSDHVDAYRPGHLGLPAMRERVELAGGTFDLVSAPGEGTTVSFRLPPS